MEQIKDEIKNLKEVHQNFQECTTMIIEDTRVNLQNLQYLANLAESLEKICIENGKRLLEFEKRLESLEMKEKIEPSVKISVERAESSKSKEDKKKNDKGKEKVNAKPSHQNQGNS